MKPTLVEDESWRAVPITSGLLAEIFDAFSGAHGFNIVVQKVRERQAAFSRLADTLAQVGEATARLSDAVKAIPDPATMQTTPHDNEIVQRCIDAITAEGVRVSETANDSWRAGMFHAAEVLRDLQPQD
jgi:hypothetical protein